MLYIIVLFFGIGHDVRFVIRRSGHLESVEGLVLVQLEGNQLLGGGFGHSCPILGNFHIMNYICVYIYTYIIIYIYMIYVDYNKYIV